jgi:hypothetical protein
MNPSCRISLVLVLGVATIQGSCSSDDPTRVGRPPVVESYSPGSKSLTVYVGDVVDFRLDAFDPDRDPLSTEFTVDGIVVANAADYEYAVIDTGVVTVRGSVRDGDMNFGVLAVDPEGAPVIYRFVVDGTLVAQERQFTYHAVATGIKIVRAFASDGVNEITREWRLKVTEIPDAIPPAAIDILLFETGTNPGEVDLQWIAVGRDGMAGTASQYRVRTHPTPILTQQDWNLASERPGVPDPANAGEVMSMTLTGLQPARNTHVAIRAEDDFGNQSPLLETPSAVTRGMRISGHVRDARTNLPVGGAVVSFGLSSASSDAAGEWVLAELGFANDFIVVRDEGGASVGAYYDYTLPYAVVHEDRIDLFLLPALALETTHYPDFLTWFRHMTDIAGNPHGAETRRWELPVTMYVRAFTKSGLDYRATIERVAAEFNAILGEDAFTVVTTGVSDGVETAYVDDLPQDNYGVAEWTTDWYPRRGLIQFRTTYSPPTESVLEVVARHEMGHVLGLNHSDDFGHIMVGGVAPQVAQFSNDEVALIQCRYHLPRGWDCRRFERN